MFRPLKIVVALDGTGVYYDYSEPPMLDGILAALLCRWHVHGEPPARDEVPADIPLPLLKWKHGGTWGWCASALLPDGENLTTAIQYWRKRFREQRAELTKGSPNLTNGTYRNWSMPLPLLLTPRLIGYAVGDAHNIRHTLRRDLRAIGKKRAHGRGNVTGVTVEVVDQDNSCVMEGKAMRWLPDVDGTRFVRPRPPYWNICERVQCMEIGEATTWQT